MEYDSSSQITHLLISDFLQHFQSTFPHPTPWGLCLLKYAVTPRLHTMLLIKHSPKACPLQDSTGKHFEGEIGYLLWVDPHTHVPQSCKRFNHFLTNISHKENTRLLTAKKKFIQDRRVEKYIHSMGGIFVALGISDPQLNIVGDIQFCLVQ